MTGLRCEACGNTFAGEATAAICPQCGSDRVDVLASTVGDSGAQLEAFPQRGPEGPSAIDADDIERTLDAALEMLEKALDEGGANAVLEDQFAEELHRTLLALGVDPPTSDEPEDVERALADAKTELERLDEE